MDTSGSTGLGPWLFHQARAIVVAIAAAGAKTETETRSGK